MKVTRIVATIIALLAVISYTLYIITVYPSVPIVYSITRALPMGIIIALLLYWGIVLIVNILAKIIKRSS
ncbi:hypothetical protein [Dehalococcoides mccartyi]|uniref:hypothetical protein n=1 Tax=Dehalococcoides mccartyi TaxID=61435 RepID=UPI001A0BE3B5|nr:hypothetical protein [Dehalococcoides mccartyi]MBF4481857.1 hypothetical protein [Dehalococcoides mccartyi]MBJ7531213.1 hypothetical protein [Dehalococcoides mccartyi]